MESVSGRGKLGCLRQENACLSMQEELLISDIDAFQYDLVTSKPQVNLRGPKNGGKNVAVMSQQIRHLEAAVETTTKELRAAEIRAECSQEAAAHCDIMVVTLTEERNKLQEELTNRTVLYKRAEQQRNQALENAEKLKETLKDYKTSVSMKLERVMENENTLKASLFKCDREKEELEVKCTLLEKEKAEQSQTISKLKEELRQTQSSAVDCAELQTQLEDARQRAAHLERQLKERDAECRQLPSLRREVEDLRSLSKSEEQRASQSQREAQRSQTELASLEAILGLLHLREGAVGSLCVRPCLLPPVDLSRAADLLRLKPGEGYQQLVQVLQHSEAERTKQSEHIERLQERLSRAQEEVCSLQSSMDQRASHYQNLHTELLCKVNQATDTEKELRRKSARVAALEKQLQEKTSAYSQAALKNTELENQLLEKTNSLQHYQSLISKKQRAHQQTLEKCKNSQAQQTTEQQHRIEMLQLSVEEAHSRVLAMEQELCSLQTERDEAQALALLLQTSLEKLKQERQADSRHKDGLLQIVKEQESQSVAKVCELQSSLAACREEVSSYLLQMEEVKESYEAELQKTNDRLSSLQQKLHSSSVVCQSSSEQNVQLQLSLQQQQTMLTESTARIAELEESQSQLQGQVSTLEQQLERARASLQDEMRNRTEDTQERDKNLQEMEQKNIQLSDTVSHQTTEMTKCRGELVSKEAELQRLRKDIAAKTSQISYMDKNLQHLKNLLDNKNDIVEDLEEKLHRCEADRSNSVQHLQVLQGQLQAVRAELTETLSQLQLLNDVLQKTQTIADERRASVEKLTIQLSETQRELEERTHEVLDMDTALKERQAELQQRAKLLGQLDVAIREHKQEMEKKVESLQQSLDAREKELRKLMQTNAEKDVWHCRIKDELALKEATWQQSEARLQSVVASLEQELELQREQHSKELDSLQQSRGQVLKVSEQISSTMRSSHEQLTVKLQQSQTQLEQTEAELDRSRTEARLLQTQLEQSQSQFLQSENQLKQTLTLCEQTKAQNHQLHLQLEQLSALFQQTRVQAAQLQSPQCSESLLIKESEMTHVTTRSSSQERAADPQTLFAHTSKFTSSSENRSSAHSPPPREHHCPPHDSAHLPSQLSSSAPVPADLRPTPVSHLSFQTESRRQINEWLQSSSVDSSLDLPQSLKATLREALNQQPWDSSDSDTVSHSWKDLSAVDTSGTFDPLTYMLDAREDANRSMHLAPEGDDGRTGESRRECVSTVLVGDDDEEDMDSLTGMLRFIHQALAKQDDSSLWSSAVFSQTGRRASLQSTIKET